jgi:hypothetical protein
LANNLKLTVQAEGMSLSKDRIKKGRGADYISPRKSMTRRGANMEGLGHAIGNDNVRSSNWLRIKDFQPCDLPGRYRFDWFYFGGIARVGVR